MACRCSADGTQPKWIDYLKFGETTLSSGESHRPASDQVSWLVNDRAKKCGHVAIISKHISYFGSAKATCAWAAHWAVAVLRGEAIPGLGAFVMAIRESRRSCRVREASVLRQVGLSHAGRLDTMNRLRYAAQQVTCPRSRAVLEMAGYVLGKRQGADCPWLHPFSEASEIWLESCAVCGALGCLLLRAWLTRMGDLFFSALGIRTFIRY